MKFFSLLLQFFAFAIMTIFESVKNVANEVYGNNFMVRNVEQGIDEILLRDRMG